MPRSVREATAALMELVEWITADVVNGNFDSRLESRRVEAGLTALRRLEHEIAPVLAEIRQTVAAHEGSVVSCPLCAGGEAFVSIDIYADPTVAAHRPVRYSCGHLLVLADPPGDLVTLALQSDIRILPQQSAQFTERPWREAMRPIRIAIPDAFARFFVVENISIGNASQFTGRGGMSGELFAASAAYSPIRFDTCQVAMDIVVSVRYVGSDPDGVAFSCVVMGRRMLARPASPPRDAVHLLPTEQQSLLDSWYEIVGGSTPDPE